jgi:hypothetical protein
MRVEQETQHKEKERAFLKHIKFESTTHLAKRGLGSIIGVARTLAMCIAYFLKGYDVVAQHNIVQKTLSHEILTGMVLSYL